MPEDVPRVALLCGEHARFEGGRVAEDLESRLPGLLFVPDAGLVAWVVEDPQDGTLHGYATAGVELSTWRGTRFLHLDCLYLTQERRGRGIGRMLLDAVRQHAAAEGIGWLEWQTPAWNGSAIRFYQRCGAGGLPKMRFSMPADPGA